MKRATGTYVESSILGEVVKAFVPHSLPPQKPTLALDVYFDDIFFGHIVCSDISGKSAFEL